MTRFVAGSSVEEFLMDYDAVIQKDYFLKIYS